MIIPPIPHIHLHLTVTTMNGQAWTVIKASSVGQKVAFTFGCREVKCVSHQLWLATNVKSNILRHETPR